MLKFSWGILENLFNSFNRDSPSRATEAESVVVDEPPSHLPFGRRAMAVEAERRGFEPRIHFWRIHTFQACSLNHSDISPLPAIARRPKGKGEGGFVSYHPNPNLEGRRGFFKIL